MPKNGFDIGRLFTGYAVFVIGKPGNANHAVDLCVLKSGFNGLKGLVIDGLVNAADHTGVL